jgi:hypothetical protein
MLMRMICICNQDDQLVAPPGKEAGRSMKTPRFDRPRFAAGIGIWCE